MPVYAQDHGKDRIHVKKTVAGWTESLNQFENYYSNMRNLKAAKAVDVCYKILGTAIEKDWKMQKERE